MKLADLEIEWINIVDYAIVGFLLYSTYKLVRGSVASRVLVGYIFVYVFYLIVKALRLTLLTTILEYFMGVGAIALIVLFQQEIRRFLLLIGKTTSLTNNRFMRTVFSNQVEKYSPNSIKIVVEATKTLANEFNGGIIVLQKNDDLLKFVESGDLIDGILSKRLLLSIFGQYSPLNDGATIISNNRVKAAHCVLPVASNDDLPTSFGFRHRAALGISEATDAIAIVISEDSGKISLAINGKIEIVSVSDLEKELKKNFAQN